MSGDDEPLADEEASATLGEVFRTLVPDTIRQSFTLKFLIVLLVMGLVIVLIGAGATAQLSSETSNQVENEYSGLAAQEANVVEEWYKRNKQAVQLSSSKQTWAKDDTAQLNSELRTEEGRLGVEAMHLVEQRPTGLFVVASSGSVEDNTPVSRDSIGNRAVFQSLADGITGGSDIAVSDAYEAEGEPVVAFASKIGVTQKKYLFMEVSVRNIASSFQGAEQADRGFTQVVNDDNVVQIDERADTTTTDTRDVLTAYADGNDALRPIRKANELRDSSEQSGVIARMEANEQVLDEPYAVGYAPIENTDWVVVVHAPVSEVFGFVNAVQQWGVIATIAAVLAIGVVGGVLGYNTSSSIDRLRAKAEQIEEGNLDVDISSPRIDNIGRLYDSFGSMRDSLREQIKEAERARKEAEVSRAEAMEVNEYLQDRAEEYSEIMQQCARGDLTRRMDTEGENEAMDQIAQDFNEMIEELEMTTGQLKTFAEEVGEAGEGVKQSAETVRDASEQVADSIQKISDDSYDQKERLDAIAQEIDATLDQLESLDDEHPNLDLDESLDYIRDVAETVKTAGELGEETMAESENVAGAAEEQAAELNEVSSRADELTRNARYLSDGLNHFDTEAEHEFVFQTGAGATPGQGSDSSDEQAE